MQKHINIALIGLTQKQQKIICSLLRPQRRHFELWLSFLSGNPAQYFNYHFNLLAYQLPCSSQFRLWQMEYEPYSVRQFDVKSLQGVAAAIQRFASESLQQHSQQIIYEDYTMLFDGLDTNTFVAKYYPSPLYHYQLPT